MRIGKKANIRSKSNEEMIKMIMKVMETMTNKIDRIGKMMN